jgi:hypothetical protein
MDSHHLRAILLKLQDRLSDDDLSLGDTLCLLESLFDQNKINERDFTFLINTVDEIQCLDAVKLLTSNFWLDL